MSATSEPQVPKLDSRELVSLLQQQVPGGEPCPHSFIYKVDAYSAPPADLIRGRNHAPGTDQGDGKGRKWYFLSPARYHDRKGGGSTSTQKRHRKVPGGGTWHAEAGKIAVRDAGGHTVGYERALNLVNKTKNSYGEKSCERLGWCMKEFCLHFLDGADKLVLCVVYKSPRADPAIFTDASSSAVATNGVFQGGVILDGSLVVPMPDGDTPVPPPASCDYSLHSPGPWVASEPDLSIVPFPNQQTLCMPGGEIVSSTSRVAILKKVNAASVAVGVRDGEKAAAARVVMKFGRSSIPSVELMKEMAKLVLNYPSELGQIVAVVLSEIGDTTNNIFLAARKALTCTDQNVSGIHEFGMVKRLYFRIVDELGLDSSIVSGPLDELEHHLGDIAITKEITVRTREYLLFFGERTSTKIFFEHLNELRKGRLQEWELCDVTTMGRSSSYLTAITIGRALGSTEIQAWKDVDGVFTCDPKIYEKAILLQYLTFDEGAELMYFCEQSRQLALEGAISVVVKNSCNPQALGTVINKTGYMSESMVTSIVLKSNISMLDIERISMFGQDAFVEKGLSIFKDLKDLGIAVDCVVTSEGKMSFALFPSKLLSKEWIQLELDNVVAELRKMASIDLLQHRSVISLIGNAPKPAHIVELALTVVRGIDVVVQKVSQESSKVMKVSLFVNDSEAQDCVKALHDAFFEKVFEPEVEGAENECPIPEIPIQENPIAEIPIQMNPVPKGPTQENPISESPVLEKPIPENSSVAASSGFKRKSEAPPGWSQELTETCSSALGSEDIVRYPKRTVTILEDDNMDVDDAADLLSFSVAENLGLGGLPEHIFRYPIWTVSYSSSTKSSSIFEDDYEHLGWRRPSHWDSTDENIISDLFVYPEGGIYFVNHELRCQ